MATVFKRDGSPYWFACFSDQHGKTVRKSTKTTDRALALRMSLELEHAEFVAKRGHASVAAFQKVMSDISEKVIGEALPSQSIREYFQEWLTFLPRSNSPTTVRRYTNTVRMFLDGLGKIADQPLRSIQARDVEGFLHRRLQAGLAPKTVITDIKSIGAALRRAERYGYIDRNPVPAVKMPKGTSTEREVFTLDEIYKILQAAPNEDWQTLILLGAFTGARLGDCLRLTWDNMDATHKVLVFKQAKTGRQVMLPLHVDLLNHLTRLSKTGTVGPLCRSLVSNIQTGKGGLSQGFKKIVRRAGVDLMEVTGLRGRKFCRRTFHSLRHTFSSILATRGVSEELRMRLTGHASRDIHQRYTHLNTETLQQAIDTIPAKTEGG